MATATMCLSESPLAGLSKGELLKERHRAANQVNALQGRSKPTALRLACANLADIDEALDWPKRRTADEWFEMFSQEDW